MDSCVEQEALCQALTGYANTPGQFSSHACCRVTRVTRSGEAVGELEVAPEVLNVWGTVHGGALSTLADTVAGTGVVAATGGACVTVNSSMNYLRPAAGRKIVCTARPEKLGQHICVMRAVLVNDQGETVSTGEFTFCVIGLLEQVAKERSSFS